MRIDGRGGEDHGVRRRKSEEREFDAALISVSGEGPLGRDDIVGARRRRAAGSGKQRRASGKECKNGE